MSHDACVDRTHSMTLRSQGLQAKARQHFAVFAVVLGFYHQH